MTLVAANAIGRLVGTNASTEFDIRRQRVIIICLAMIRILND